MKFVLPIPARQTIRSTSSADSSSIDDNEAFPFV